MSLKKSTSIFLVSLATMISRILGLVREQLFAFLFGASNFSDAFLVAFRIPNLLRDLFAEGALSTAFIPTFTHYLIKHDKKQAFQLANYVINFLLVVIGFLIILGYCFTPDLVRLIAPGFQNNPEKFHLTILMTRILIPFLLFVSFASVFMGILNTHNKFFISALAPALFNVVIILTGVLIIFFHPQDIDKAILWAVGALAGGLIQLFIQLPSSYKLGYRYKFSMDWRLQHEGLKRIVKLMLPAVIGLAAVQINIIVNTILASYLHTGSISHWNYAFRLIQFPIGIFAVSIATVNTAVISKDIVNKDFKMLKENISFSIKMNSFFAIPSTVFLMTLGIPVIQLIFQHGKFDSIATAFTYGALLFLAPCLFFYSGVKLFVPVFYAMKKSFIPVISSVMAVVVNLIISINTYKIIGIKGLALGLTCGAFINFVFLLLMFIYYYGLIKGRNLFSSISKHLFSSFCMGLCGIIVYQIFIDKNYILSIIFPIIISGIVYAGISYLLKVKEFSDFLNIFKARFKYKK